MPIITYDPRPRSRPPLPPHTQVRRVVGLLVAVVATAVGSVGGFVVLASQPTGHRNGLLYLIPVSLGINAVLLFASSRLHQRATIARAKTLALIAFISAMALTVVAAGGYPGAFIGAFT